MSTLLADPVCRRVVHVQHFIQRPSHMAADTIETFRFYFQNNWTITMNKTNISIYLHALLLRACFHFNHRRRWITVTTWSKSKTSSKSRRHTFSLVSICEQWQWRRALYLLKHFSQTKGTSDNRRADRNTRTQKLGNREYILYSFCECIGALARMSSNV